MKEVKFRPDEMRERRNKDGTVSQFPIVGGRLRLAHELNEKLSITTELLAHVPLEAATMKATVTTAKGSFSAYGAASAEKDQRLIDSLLELAETRAIARGLRFAGYGVEYAGIEEIPDDNNGNGVHKPAPPVQGPKADNADNADNAADDDFIPMTRAQRHAIEVICKVNGWNTIDEVRRVLKASDITSLDDVSKAEASTVISALKSAKAA